MGNKVRVLVVDDSALVRQILTQGLNADPDIEVVASAPDPYVARDRIVELEPDVMTLDVEMPRMDGVDFLRRLMPQHPIPVVMVSSLTRRGQQVTLDALAAGAVDFVPKPASDVGRALPQMMGELCEKVKAAARANVAALELPADTRRIESTRSTQRESTDKVIAIGASTGGTEAVRRVLEALPRTMPGIVVVLHMPPGFTHRFAEKLDASCSLLVKEADSRDRIMTGHALIAPGDRHLEVRRTGGFYQVEIHDGERVNNFRPSVDVLMRSIARHAGPNGIGVILTGMGCDGAEGLLELRRKGGRTLVQDETTSVVFGMPKAAIERGGAEQVVPIGDVATRIVELLG